jgi:hypothetical protein
VRELRVARAFVVLLCIALLLLCFATTPSAAHLDLAIPVLVFCFLVVLQPSRLRDSYRAAAIQPLTLLSFQTSRAPPLA